MTQDHPLPKHPGLAEFMVHLAGPGDIVSTSDWPHWKKWRSIFNPGFASAHLITLASSIVDESLIFVDTLQKHAEKGHAFRLEEEATRLTVDIIGKVTMNVELGTQRGENKVQTNPPTA